MATVPEPHANGGGLTSFGTAMIPEMAESLQETAVKIRSIDKNAAVAIAGNSAAAFDAIDVLRQCFAAKLSTESTLHSLAISRQGPERLEHFQLLLADARPDVMGIWHWDSRTGRAHQMQPDEVLRIGTPIVEIERALQSMLPQFIDTGIKDHVVHLAATACYQSILLKSLAVASGIGVGGIVLSARIDANGVHWVNDAAYVVMESRNDGLDVVHVVCRHGGVAYFSPHLPTVNILLTDNDPEGWLAKWGSEAMGLFNNRQASVWAFISRTSDALLIIHDEKPFSSCDAFRIEPNDQGKQILVLKLGTSLLLQELSSGQHGLLAVTAPKQHAFEHIAQTLQRLTAGGTD